MLIGETLRSSIASLAANRLRTALTALGIVIGVGAVIAVLAIGEGAKANVERRIRSLGSNLLMVRPGQMRAGGIRTGAVDTLTRDDADAVRRLPGVSLVSGEASGSGQIRYRENNRNASVVGVTPDYFRIRSLDIGSGLGFSDADDREHRRVALIGATVARDLFGAASPIGERIQIRGTACVVIGVIATQGDSGFMSPDDMVFVPLSTHQSVLFGQDYLSSMSVQVVDESQTDAVVTRIAELLRLRHRIGLGADDDFEVRSQTEMLQTMGQITGTFTNLLGSIAAVSLLVGGIGIMNIMLVSVHERTREIGVRMAVGARRKDILLQFLVESVVVSVFGGLLGIVFGFAAATLVARVAGWETVVPAYSIGLALTVSVGVGVLFGVGPARRAAGLDPVEALRHE